MNKNELVELLNSMTMKEKIGQLLQLSGAFYSNKDVVTGPLRFFGIDKENVALSGSTLNLVSADAIIHTQKEYLEKSNKKIPLLFMADVINGYKTIFPTPLALGCTFHPELLGECARIAAKEASVAGLHVTFSPMVDLVRDARWGRVMESTGEDSFLNSVYAKEIVKGYQGNSLLDEYTIAACVKHFAAYGAPSGGREYGWVDMSERLLREQYLVAYKAAIDEKCALVMTSFNTLNGIPATGSKWLMREVLRDEWGFDGVIISDYAAIAELVGHGYAKDGEEAAKMGIEAGVDIDMMSSVYVKNLEKLIHDKKVSIDLLDESVLRVLELKNKLGLFENPYRFASPKLEKELILSKEHRQVARKAATESMVLLKNNGILPLKKTMSKKQRISFIGPYVDSKSLYGAWSIFGNREDAITLKEAVINRKEEIEIEFLEGCKMLSEDPWNLDKRDFTPLEEEKMLEEAILLASNSDVVVLALGEHYLYSGEGSSRADITLPKIQLNLFEQIYEVNKNIIVVLFNGRPLDIVSIEGKAAAILEAWYPGTEGGNAVCDILFGEVNPSGRLSMSFPYCVGQVPIYYNNYNTGRPANDKVYANRYSSRYIDIPNKPLYPFGYGLSYSEFEYSNLKLEDKVLTSTSSINASVIIKNNSECRGTEIIQLYIRDLYGSVVRPLKELKGFRRISFEPYEEREVTFEIREDMLRFYNSNMNYESEEGEFTLFIGHDSSVSNGINFILKK
jgi:beta-glucosidase